MHISHGSIVSLIALQCVAALALPSLSDEHATAVSSNNLRTRSGTWPSTMEKRAPPANHGGGSSSGMELTSWNGIHSGGQLDDWLSTALPRTQNGLITALGQAPRVLQATADDLARLVVHWDGRADPRLVDNMKRLLQSLHARTKYLLQYEASLQHQGQENSLVHFDSELARQSRRLDGLMGTVAIKGMEESTAIGDPLNLDLSRMNAMGPALAAYQGLLQEVSSGPTAAPDRGERMENMDPEELNRLIVQYGENAFHNLDRERFGK